MLGISGRTLGKITSSFMVITSDDLKNNLGLSIKFEGKSMKVIDYSRKDSRSWEYSQKALDLISEYKVRIPLLCLAEDRSFVHAEGVPRPFPCGREEWRW